MWPDSKSWVNEHLDANVREGNTWVSTQSLWKITIQNTSDLTDNISIVGIDFPSIIFQQFIIIVEDGKAKFPES